MNGQLRRFDRSEQREVYVKLLILSLKYKIQEAVIIRTKSIRRHLHMRGPYYSNYQPLSYTKRFLNSNNNEPHARSNITLYLQLTTQPKPRLEMIQKSSFRRESTPGTPRLAYTVPTADSPRSTIKISSTTQLLQLLITESWNGEINLVYDTYYCYQLVFQLYK